MSDTQETLHIYFRLPVSTPHYQRSAIQPIIEDSFDRVLRKYLPLTLTSESKSLGGIELAEEITGFKKATIYRLTSMNQIPCYKRGKRLYFDWQKLLDWIKKD